MTTTEGAQAADPDHAALERLCRERWKSLTELAWLLIGDRDLAQDIVQDAFLALSRRWHRLAAREAASAYLRTSVVNGARTAIKHRALARRKLNAVVGVELVEPAEASAVRNDVHRRVLSAVADLPRRQREVIVLRYWADLSEAEIAATLGVSKGTVKNAAARARATIGLKLEETDEH